MKAKRVTALVDLDPIVYAAGFVVEDHSYILNWVDVGADGDTERFARFESAWRRDAFMDILNLHPDEVASHMHVIPHPKENALHVVNGWIERIGLAVEGFLAEKGLELGAVEGFLTGKGNFRDTLATVKPYKGNRDPSKRPFWYSEIRSHLISRHGAVVTQGIEADDAIAMRQWQEDMDDPGTIVCTIDKDLLMVPGLHYNYGKMTSFHQSWDGALLAFWRQLLVGDASDNIPGLYKVGPGTAAKVFPKYLGEPQMFALALAQYEKNLAAYPEKHAPHTTALESLVENARLLWMMTGPDDLWHPPGAEGWPTLSEWRASLTPADPDEGYL